MLRLLAGRRMNLDTPGMRMKSPEVAVHAATPTSVMVLARTAASVAVNRVVAVH